MMMPAGTPLCTGRLTNPLNCLRYFGNGRVGLEVSDAEGAVRRADSGEP